MLMIIFLYTFQTATITEVNLFQGSALIKKEMTLKADKGRQTLSFKNLPAALIDESVRISGVGNGKLHDIQIKKIFYTEIPDKRISEIQTKKIKLNKEISIINDNQNTLSNEKKLLENMTQMKVDQSNNAQTFEFSVTKWDALLKYYKQKIETINKENRNYLDRKDELSKEINKLDEELNELNRNKNKWNKEINIDLEMYASQNLTLICEYLVNGPSWKADYKLFINSEKNEAEIEYNAIVTQNTGEDWNTIVLFISSANLNEIKSEPTLYPQILDEFQNIVFRGGRSMQNNASSYKMLKSEDQLQEDEILENESAEITQKETNVSSVYRLKNKVTIASDNQIKKFFITSIQSKAVLTYSATVKLQPKVFVQAKFKNESEFPLINSQAAVYLDNSFVNKINLNYSAAFEELKVDLGYDDRIKVERKKVKRYEEESGFISKSRRIHYEYDITIENNSKKEIDLVLKDQFPLSANEKIKVTKIRPTDKEAEINKENIIYWKLKLKPQTKQTVPLHYNVEYDKDMNITGLE